MHKETRYCFSTSKNNNNPFSLSPNDNLPIIEVMVCNGEVKSNEFITTTGKHYPLNNTISESETSDNLKINEIKHRLLEEAKNK